MMSYFQNLSLKFKVVLLGVGLTVSMLSIYSFLALSDFRKDKLAYVMDSGLSHVRATALQVRSEISVIVSRVQFLMRGYDRLQHKIHPYTKSIFTNENNFDGLWIYEQKMGSSDFDLKQGITNRGWSDENEHPLNLMGAGFGIEVLDHDLTLKRLPSDNSKWLLSIRYTVKSSERPLLVVAAINTSHFLEIFNADQLHDTYLMDHKNYIAIAPQSSTYNMPDNELTQAVNETVEKFKSAETIHTFQSAKNSETWLISKADVGIGGLKIFSFTPRSAALEAVRLLIIKSGIFVVFLFFVTLFLSVLSSAGLTASLKNLLNATIKISSGDFNVAFEDKVGGEVGALAKGFNKMAVEIQRLLGETAEKARMENELKTAQLVQSTLFPKEGLASGPLHIEGFYLPAGECSGDWWHYEVVGNRILFGIGDATGHGVPAALLTCAARSAATAVQNFPSLTLPEIMGIFNRSIYNTANGQVMMTFFLGSYDLQTGKLEYCNASHEPPCLLRQLDRPLKKQDLEFLNASTGPRLGQDISSTYKSSTVLLQPKDRIVFYTDGVTELINKKGDMLGERRFLKNILEAKNTNQDLSISISGLAKSIEEFRAGAPLADDVTYFMIERSDVA